MLINSIYIQFIDSSFLTVFHVLVAATADVSAYKSVSLKAGAELVLSVPVYGNPKPSVAWKLSEKDVLGNIKA